MYVQQGATLHSLFISGKCSTCFGWYLHPSSGAHTTVYTTSGTCQGRDAVSTNIVIDKKIIEQVNSFNYSYLGNMMSYEGELDVVNKLNNHLKITGILNNVFRPQKKTLRKQE